MTLLISWQNNYISNNRLDYWFKLKPYLEEKKNTEMEQYYKLASTIGVR